LAKTDDEKLFNENTSQVPEPAHIFLRAFDSNRTRDITNLIGYLEFQPSTTEATVALKTLPDSIAMERWK
jgi:hypothetical protein